MIESTGFGDCNGEGLGTFHFGEEDELAAWDTSPRLHLVGVAEMKFYILLVSFASLFNFMHVQAEESTPIRVGVTFLGSERCVPVYQLVVCQTYFFISFFFFFSHRRASDSMLASNYQNKRNIAASNEYVAENDTSPVNQQQSDVASALCDRTSHIDCLSQPVQYHPVYDTFSRIFTAYHRAPNKHAGMTKKTELHNAGEIAALYHSFCSHLQKYKTGKCIVLTLVLLKRLA